MIIYSQHYFKRKMRKTPAPSYLPITIAFAILSVCIIAIMPPVVTGIKIDMPRLDTQPIEIFDDFTYITIDYLKEDKIIINNTEINQDEAGKAIKMIYKNLSPENIKVFIKADKKISYNSIITLLKTLNNSGFTDITLVGQYTGGQDLY